MGTTPVGPRRGDSRGFRAQEVGTRGIAQTPQLNQSRLDGLGGQHRLWTRCRELLCQVAGGRPRRGDSRGIRTQQGWMLWRTHHSQLSSGA